MVTNVVLVTFAVYLIDVVFTHLLTKLLELDPWIFVSNWRIWQVVTYGFVHSPDDVGHILFNMLFLWFLGRDVEAIYGKSRFLAFYLSTIVISGLVGTYTEAFLNGGVGRPLIGASGGVAGVVALSIFHYPRRTILLWFIIPVPIWVLGVGYLAMDFIGTFDATSNVAHSAHLAGAACGWLYFKTQWDLGRLLPSAATWKRLKPRPNVRIHNPDAEDTDLSAEVDRLLEKISREGEDSLTRKERRTLERASLRYKQRQK